MEENKEELWWDVGQINNTVLGGKKEAFSFAQTRRVSASQRVFCLAANVAVKVEVNKKEC